MTHQQRAFEEDRSTGNAGRSFAHLNHMLGLVEQIAGRAASGSHAIAGEGERIDGAYRCASPLVQRRFDAMAGETAMWAAAGVDALAAATDPPVQPRAAAACLADELDRSLSQMARLLRL